MKKLISLGLFSTGALSVYHLSSYMNISDYQAWQDALVLIAKNPQYLISSGLLGPSIIAAPVGTLGGIALFAHTSLSTPKVPKTTVKKSSEKDWKQKFKISTDIMSAPKFTSVTSSLIDPIKKASNFKSKKSYDITDSQDSKDWEKDTQKTEPFQESSIQEQSSKNIAEKFMIDQEGWDIDDSFSDSAPEKPKNTIKPSWLHDKKDSEEKKIEQTPESQGGDEFEDDLGSQDKVDDIPKQKVSMDIIQSATKDFFEEKRGRSPESFATKRDSEDPFVKEEKKSQEEETKSEQSGDFEAPDWSFAKTDHHEDLSHDTAVPEDKGDSEQDSSSHDHETEEDNEKHSQSSLSESTHLEEEGLVQRILNFILSFVKKKENGDDLSQDEGDHDKVENESLSNRVIEWYSIWSATSGDLKNGVGKPAKIISEGAVLHDLFDESSRQEFMDEYGLKGVVIIQSLSSAKRLHNGKPEYTAPSSPPTSFLSETQKREDMRQFEKEVEDSSPTAIRPQPFEEVGPVLIEDDLDLETKVHATKSDSEDEKVVVNEQILAEKPDEVLNRLKEEEDSSLVDNKKISIQEMMPDPIRSIQADREIENIQKKDFNEWDQTIPVEDGDLESVYDSRDISEVPPDDLGPVLDTPLDKALVEEEESKKDIWIKSDNIEIDDDLKDNDNSNSQKPLKFKDSIRDIASRRMFVPFDEEVEKTEENETQEPQNEETEVKETHSVENNETSNHVDPVADSFSEQVEDETGNHSEENLNEDEKSIVSEVSEDLHNNTPEEVSVISDPLIIDAIFVFDVFYVSNFVKISSLEISGPYFIDSEIGIDPIEVFVKTVEPEVIENFLDRIQDEEQEDPSSVSFSDRTLVEKMLNDNFVLANSWVEGKYVVLDDVSVPVRVVSRAFFKKVSLLDGKNKSLGADLILGDWPYRRVLENGTAGLIVIQNISLPQGNWKLRNNASSLSPYAGGVHDSFLFEEIDTKALFETRTYPLSFMHKDAVRCGLRLSLIINVSLQEGSKIISGVTDQKVDGSENIFLIEGAINFEEKSHQFMDLLSYKSF